MSKTLTPFRDSHPLQLDFCAPGSLQRTMDNHLHRKSTPFAILLTTSKGSYEIYCGDDSTMIGPGQCALVQPHVMTDFIHRDGPEGIFASHWLHFRFSLYGLIDFLSLFKCPLKLPDKVGDPMHELILDSQPLGGSRRPEDLARLHMIASTALELILKHAQRRESAWRQIEQSRMRPVLHFIRENLANTLTVDALSHIAGLSPSRFHALFSQEFGCSPMRYVKQQRLEAAARMLAGSDFKLAQVADITGFSDAFHLSHAFKAQYKLSPREYRIASASWKNEPPIPASKS